MGRRSEAEPLVDRTQASGQARERAKVILLTLGRDVSVREGCERLRISRTRFQDLSCVAREQCNLTILKMCFGKFR